MEKTYKFSESEYSSLRAELIERIKIMNTQSSTILVTILSTWAVGITVEIALYSKEILFNEVFGYSVMHFLGSLLFLIPIFFFMPLSVKSGENLTQIASLSAYIRVFFDNPMHGKKSFNWETSNNLLSNVNVDRERKSRLMYLFNEEYTVLSIVTFGIFLLLGILNINNLYILYKAEKIPIYNIVILAVLYTICGIIVLFVIYVIHKVSCIKNALMNSTVYYVNGYINRALELNIFSQEEIADIVSELNPKRRMPILDFYDL